MPHEEANTINRIAIMEQNPYLRVMPSGKVNAF